MLSVVLDSTGRLIEFQAVPTQVITDTAPPRAPDWTPLFEAAGLDLSVVFTGAAAMVAARLRRHAGRVGGPVDRPAGAASSH